MTGAKSLTGFAVAAAMAFGFLAFVSANFVNFPVGDDFRSIFPISIATKTEGLQALSWESVAAQHWSHRIVAVRLFAALQTWLFGGVNLTAFLWAGLLMWIAAFCLLARKEGWLGLPVVGLLASVVWFQPQSASNLLVAMQAVQNIGVILLAFAAFALRAQAVRWSFAAAWACAIFAWFTAGNGLLVPVILIAWDCADKRWSKAALGGLLLCLSGWLYFRHFENPESQTYGFDPVHLAGNALVMSGSIFRFGTAPLSVAMVGGFILGLCGLVALWRRLKLRDLFGTACLLFIFGSIGMASIARLGWGMEYMAQGRYRVYAVMLLAFVLAAAGRHFAGKPLATVLLLMVGGVFAAASWWQYAPEVVNTGRAASASAMSYHLGQPALFSENEKALAASLQRLDAAVAARVYLPPLSEDAEKIGSRRGAQLPTTETECRYEQGVSGFVVRIQGSNRGLYLLAEDRHRVGMRLAVRPMQRMAMGALLGRSPQRNHTDYLMPVSAAGRETAASTVFFNVGN